MEEISQEVLDFIESIEEQSKKELDWIKKNDWSKMSVAVDRTKTFKIQQLIITNNIDHAIKLFKLAEKDMKIKKVKETFNMLLDFFDIFEKRRNYYIKKHDWSELIDNSMTEDASEKEITFQSTMLNTINALREKIRPIRNSDSTITLNLPIHNNTPIPLSMYESAIRRYPEILDVIEAKRNTNEKK